MRRQIVASVLKRMISRRSSAAAIMICLTLGVAGSAADNSLPKQWAGIWTLRKDLGAPGISALTDADARELIGKTIRISDRQVLLGGEECASPAFHISTQTTADFLGDYKVSRSQFPLSGETLEILDIKCDRSVTHRFSRLKNGCALFSQDGRFFQMIRVGRGSKPSQGIPQCLEKR